MTSAGHRLERVRRPRDRLRAAGLRPVQTPVPDTRSAAFEVECARQSRLIREAEAADEEAAWFEVSDRTA